MHPFFLFVKRKQKGNSGPPLGATTCMNLAALRTEPLSVITSITLEAILIDNKGPVIIYRLGGGGQRILG